MSGEDENFDEDLQKPSMNDILFEPLFDWTKRVNMFTYDDDIGADYGFEL